MTLMEKRCRGCEGEVAPLTLEMVKSYLDEVREWHLGNENKAIIRQFSFKNYYHTIAFVNAIAYMSHSENHHPDMEISYNRCKISYTTHAIGGLSENDFICAAKVNKLFQDSKSFSK